MTTKNLSRTETLEDDADIHRLVIFQRYPEIYSPPLSQ